MDLYYSCRLACDVELTQEEMEHRICSILEPWDRRGILIVKGYKESEMRVDYSGWGLSEDIWMSSEVGEEAEVDEDSAAQDEVDENRAAQDSVWDGGFIPDPLPLFMIG